MSESATNEVINEASEESVYASLLVPIFRRAYMRTTALEIAGVQPMAQDTFSNMNFPRFTNNATPFVEEIKVEEKIEKIERIRKKINIIYLGEI